MRKTASQLILGDHLWRAESGTRAELHPATHVVAVLIRARASRSPRTKKQEGGPLARREEAEAEAQEGEEAAAESELTPPTRSTAWPPNW